MTLHQTLEVFEALDSAFASGQTVTELFAHYPAVSVEIRTMAGETGKTDFAKIVIPGTEGRTSGGKAPTLGIVGRLGGIGARPSRIGLVSDGDGAIAAVAAALKLAVMSTRGDRLPGDVIVTTHVCPDAPTWPHEPVDFMVAPVDTEVMNAAEVLPEMDAVLSIDTTKGNRVINHKGIAISPTVRQGYILRVSDDLLRILEMTSGVPAVTFPITTQDITPYGNGIYHLNSILQPSIATQSPVAGLAISAETVVPGCGTGASHEIDIALAARFAIEVAKEFTRGTCLFHDEDEFQRLLDLYGPMTHLQALPAEPSCEAVAMAAAMGSPMDDEPGRLPSSFASTRAD